VNKLIRIANQHGFEAFRVGDMVLVYIENYNEEWAVEVTIWPVRTMAQLIKVLGY
jgi:hypothetical protein